MPVFKALTTVAPRHLSRDHRLKCSDKALRLQLAADGSGSISMHAKNMGVSYATAFRATKRLLEYDWAQEIPAGSATYIAPSVPVAVEQEVADRLIQLRDRRQPVGEWLMQCLLCLLIPDLDYEDNVRPPFLVDGRGSGRYELDRHYEAARLGFEYQGPQHEQTGGPLNITEQQLERQMYQDREKAAICAQEGIRLFWVRADDLSIIRMRDRISGVVPLTPLRQNRPMVRAVERMCRSYVNYANKNGR